MLFHNKSVNQLNKNHSQEYLTPTVNALSKHTNYR